MKLDRTPLKEKLILTAGIRLFLWEVYKVKGILEHEDDLVEITQKEFPRPEEKSEDDIDIVRETLEDLYYKLAYLILEEKK